MCWSDVSTAIILTMSTYASPDMFLNHVTLSFSQFITYRSLGSVSVCIHLLTGAFPSCMINRSQQWSWQLYEYRVLFSDAWLFLVAIKYNHSWWTILADGEIGIRFRCFYMILFRVSWYSVNEWTSFNSRTRPVGAGTQSIITSLAWSTERECACWLSNHFVHGFASGRLSFVAFSHLHQLHTSDKVS